jgi:hypothetical protein
LEFRRTLIYNKMVALKAAAILKKKEQGKEEKCSN